jgi:hypothetical protein
LFCSETYKKILDSIAKPVLDGCKLIFSTKVTKVDTFENRVSVYTDKGDSWKFDEVVFTAPLGWLKKNAANTFYPPLPQRIVQAIDNIGYGNLEKVRTTLDGDPECADVSRYMSPFPKLSGWEQSQHLMRNHLPAPFNGLHHATLEELTGIDGTRKP